MDERIFRLGFSVFPGIGPVRFRRLLTAFGSAKNAWEATVDDLKQAGLGEKLVAAFDDFRGRVSPFGYSQKVERGQIGYFILYDGEYPKLLAINKLAALVLDVKAQFDFNSLED